MKTEKQMAMATAEFAERWKGTGNVSQSVRHIVSINLKYMEDVNRLKIVLVEQKRTSKWLSEEQGVSPSTVSKWCTNSSQPDIETLARISKLLNIGVEELFNKKFMESVSNN